MSRLTNKKLVDLKYGEFISISKEEYRKQVHEAPTYKKIYTKLGQLENLEEELGCPLDVVFKALKEGIYFNFNMMLKEEFIEPTDLSLKFSLGGFYCLYLEQWNGSYIDLKDYGKTWWLKEDKE